MKRFIILENDKRKCGYCGNDKQKMNLVISQNPGINIEIVRKKELSNYLRKFSLNIDMPANPRSKNILPKIIVPSINELKNEIKTHSEKIILKKYRIHFLVIKRLEEIEKLKKIKDSDIDFSKIEWVSKISKIIDISPKKSGIWLRRVDPDFYYFCKKL